MTGPRVDRRRFLRCSSHLLALPLLASLPGARGRRGALPEDRPRRLVCVSPQLGFYAPEFFASAADPRLLRPLEAAGLGGAYTTFSGLDHRGPVANGHDFVYTFLTGQVASSISLDQVVAPVLGKETRYESFQLCAGKAHAHPSLSFSAAGVPMPALLSPSLVFAKVFGADSLALAKQEYLLDSGKSLLDGVRGEARSLQDQLDAEDRHKLEEYFSSIRELEGQLARRRDWLDRPFPKPPADLVLPEEEVLDHSMLLENEALMWDLMALALQNDSTRVLTLTIPNSGAPLLMDGEMMGEGYHSYSHHGKDPVKIENLLKIQDRHMQGAARFLAKLKATPDPEGGSLLDSTVTLIGSAMGDAATHTRTNFPLLLVGGGFAHKRHVACRTEAVNNEMACDLFVTILQRFGFETERFGSSRSNLNAALA